MNTTDAVMTHHYNPETNIHTFLFHKSGRAAVDQWLLSMDAIYEDLTPDSQVLLLVDLRESGAQPLSYIFTKAIKWIQGLKVHPTVRVAMLNKPSDSILTVMSDKFLQTLRLGHLRSNNFYGDADDEAIAWLLQKQVSR